MKTAARVRLASLVLILNGIASLPVEACFSCGTASVCLPGTCESSTYTQKYGTCVQMNPYAQICRFVTSWSCLSNWPYCDGGSGSLLTCSYGSS